VLTFVAIGQRSVLEEIDAAFDEAPVLAPNCQPTVELCPVDEAVVSKGDCSTRSSRSAVWLDLLLGLMGKLYRQFVSVAQL
jgi:hypothetical protein